MSEFSSIYDVVMSNRWPLAIDERLLCDKDNEEQKLNRGRRIAHLFIADKLSDKKVLDYGCGDGHLSLALNELYTRLSVGYDINPSKCWQRLARPSSGVSFFDDFTKIQNLAPYDSIFLYDVLDHCENPLDVLTDIKHLLSENGVAYVRTHPFISRHGSHLYRYFNKAYAHLIFTQDELESLVPGCTAEYPAQKILKPIKEYETMFSTAGLHIKTKRESNRVVENFFKTPIMSEMILKNTQMETFPHYQMSLQFIDYEIVSQNCSKDVSTNPP